MDDLTFKQWLIKVRGEKTLEVAAPILGVSKNSLHLWENGERLPISTKLYTLLKNIEQHKLLSKEERDLMSQAWNDEREKGKADATVN